MFVNIFMYQFDLLMKLVFAATERSIEEQEIVSLALEPMVIGLIFSHACPVKLKYTSSCDSAFQISARNTIKILNR